MSKIMKIENYVNEAGEQLTVLSPINDPEQEIIYMTQVMIGNQQMQVPMPVKIEGISSIEEAFQKMPETIEAVKKAIAEEQKKPRLITPSDISGKSGQMPGADTLKLVRG